MAPCLVRAQRPDAEAAASLAQHLQAFAASLPGREQAILVAMLQAALPPLDRLAFRDPGEVLSDEEVHAFNALLALGERGR